MEITLKGKRTVVTGANSGIGEAIAMEFGAAGARVAVNYVVNPEAAAQVVQRIKHAGGDALAVEADVSDAGVESATCSANRDARPRALGRASTCW